MGAPRDTRAGAATTIPEGAIAADPGRREVSALKTSVPDLAILRSLYEVRAPACVSIFLPTTPISINADESRLLFRNLAREALDRLRTSGEASSNIARCESELSSIAADSSIWASLSAGIGVFTWGEGPRLFSLSTPPGAIAQVSDRLYVKPLVAELDSRRSLHVLALSQSAVRLIAVEADGAATAVHVDGLPQDVAEVAGQSSDVDRSMSALEGREGQKVRMSHYAHVVWNALKPVLADSRRPLVLAAAQPLDGMFRAECTYDLLHPESIPGSPDRTADHELAARATLLVPGNREELLTSLAGEYELKAGRGLATSNVEHAATAATAGAVRSLVVNVDTAIPGRVDETSGAIVWAEELRDALPYDVVDEIVRRTIAHGGEVTAAHGESIPDQVPLFAVLRFAV